MLFECCSVIPELVMEESRYQLVDLKEYSNESLSTKTQCSGRKRITLVMVGQILSLFIFGLSALVGSTLGFLVYETASAPQTGLPNRLEHFLRLPDRSLSLRGRIIGPLHLHVHHWLSMSSLLCIFLYTNALSLVLPVSVHPLVYGICIGGSCQGLKYRDWFVLLWIERETEIEIDLDEDDVEEI